MKKSLFLFRSVFPSWRFFDEVESPLDLQIRVGDSDDSLGPWQDCLPPISRSLRNLILNAHGNYLHACRSHLIHLYADILEIDEANSDALLSRTSFKITRNLAEFQIRQLKLATGPFVFQFQLTTDNEAILVSPKFKCVR